MAGHRPLCLIRVMTDTALAEENALLKARLAETEAALADAVEAQRRLESIVSELRREKFGRRSEKLDPEQFNLPLEDVELAQDVLEAAQEKARRALKGQGRAENGSPNRNRGHLPKHLPRIERIIEPETTLPLRVRRDGQDWRGCVRAAGRNAGPAPRAGHPTSQICVPTLFPRSGPGACVGTCRAWWPAHRSADRPGHGGQVRRPPSILSPGGNLHPAGDHIGPGDARQLG